MELLAGTDADVVDLAARGDRLDQVLGILPVPGGAAIFPAGPTSLKPAEMIIAQGTPAFPQSRIIPGTVAAGVTITARSTFSGMELMDGKDLSPRTNSRLGFTG